MPRVIAPVILKKKLQKVEIGCRASGLVKNALQSGMNSRPYGRRLVTMHRAGFILPFGPETSGSREDLRVEGKGFTLKGIWPCQRGFSTVR
jgi:hypothetical protein